MVRAAVYARYSSELQRAQSIEDQLESCRRYIKSKGFDLVGTYEDAAVSGSSIHGRKGFQNLKADADNNKFDIVVAESVDRFARNLADVSSLNDEFNFLGIKLHTVSNGELSSLIIGIMGGIAQNQLEEIRVKTIRGQRGKVLEGLSAGGIAYGYKQKPDGEKGEREIEPYEAEIVKRIFTSYLNGMSPRKIAATLNEEGIPGPSNRDWQDTTIRGQVKRGTGLLNNDLYRGQLVWNKCSYIKNPKTGKKVAKPNPESKWETYEVPELRIISDELWQQVKDRQQSMTKEMSKDENGNALNRAHRTKHLLSGLIKCGECGSPFVMIGGDSYGCNNARKKGICKNKVSVKRKTFEKHILDALKHKMLAPEVIKNAVSKYEQAIRDVREGQTVDKSVLRARIKEIENKQSKLIAAVEAGMMTEQIVERSKQLDKEKVKLQEELEDIQTQVEEIPSAEVLEEVYRLHMDNMLTLVNSKEYPDSGFAEPIRKQIKEITCYPDEDYKTLKIMLEGSFAALVEDYTEHKIEEAASNETASTS
ncbi:recombinase family protein, partial [Candidatus Terasakiella magnetica]|uniref:recombinase family protein n=1 Tax=Candidatus Terasakiella magnetica TaxID=1867952 RepID=UPI000840D461